MQRDLTERESPELCEKVMKSLSQVPEIPKLVVNLELERDESAAVKMRMQVRAVPLSFSTDQPKKYPLPSLPTCY